MTRRDACQLPSGGEQGFQGKKGQMRKHGKTSRIVWGQYSTRILGRNEAELKIFLTGRNQWEKDGGLPKNEADL